MESVITLISVSLYDRYDMTDMTAFLWSMADLSKKKKTKQKRRHMYVRNFSWNDFTDV